MKIALVMGAYAFGGAERVMCALANHLSANNEVILITITKAERTYPIEENIKCINGIGRKNNLDGILRLRKIFVREKPNLIISFITHINIATIFASIGMKIPVIVSERNDPSKSATSKLRVLLRRISYPLASGFVFQTEDAKKYFSSFIQRRSTVIPNPLFLHVAAVPFEERRSEIVSIGRYVPQKRQDLIIKAFNSVVRDTDYTLTFYGTGDQKQYLQELVDNLGIAERVQLLDAVPDIHDRIKYAKLFVMMSEYEGMPNALMEAMGLGLACVSTDCPCGGPRFLIQDGVNGCLVDVGNQKQLEEKMQRMIHDDDFSKSLALNAELINDELSAEKVFLAWDAYIENMVNGIKKAN